LTGQLSFLTPNGWFTPAAAKFDTSTGVDARL